MQEGKYEVRPNGGREHRTWNTVRRELSLKLSATALLDYADENTYETSYVEEDEAT
jgi:hypothetical protein